MGEQFPRKFGHYHLLAPLAQGGMGALYLAVRGDRGLERLLVIKTVLPHLADSEYIARFRDEAKVVVKLSHANLIPVFDAGTVDGEIFLAMDFVEGRDLRAVWNRCAKKQVAFPIDVAVYIIKELCRGLNYAHEFGGLKLVHRDISPPNILMSFSGEVKVTDFGLASSTLKLEKTAPGIIYGKVAYMSPEQARGEPLDGRSDLYASAIVLWELLTGRQLFPPGKDQPHDLIQRARNPIPTPPSKRAPRVPAALDAICMKALAPAREDRFATGNEFRAALSDWLAAEAPGTDADRLQRFLHDLFGEDIERERAEREELLVKIRQRVKTMPPTDELRIMLDDEEGEIDKKLQRQPGSKGRRASDRSDGDSEEIPDRRQGGDRRKKRRSDGDSSDREASTPAKPRDPKAAIGTVIDGRYQIVDLIGEGGMGRVYLAEHVDIGRRVALKILHPVYSRMPELVERFRREARAASRIGHPHIVDVTDSGKTDEGAVYFVMEFLEGVGLGSIIDRSGALDINRTLRIATQICRALAAAHEAGIIHRDLKPDNIFLTTRDGRADFVKVLDFGVATSIDGQQFRAKRLTTPGMTMGTPEYMAPEQAAGRPADIRSDIYSVGAILYEALTGAPPYEGENFMEILTKKATVDPTPAHKLRPELPKDVSKLIRRAMARNPQDRPPSMEAFEYEINKCLEGRGSAVAKALGMTTDPNMVASLNPGLRMRDGEGVARRARGSSPPDVGSPSEPGVAEPESGDIGLDAFPNEHTETVVRAIGFGSRPILLGIVGAVALLIVGVGIVLVAASSEGGKKTTTMPSASVDAAAMATDTGDRADARIASSETPDAGVVAMAVIDAAPAAPPDAKKAAPPRRSNVPRSGAEARDLIKKADDLVRKRKYADAQKLYSRVLKSKFSRKDALLGQANVYYKTGKFKKVIGPAKDAIKIGGGNKARMLVGNAYFRMGQYNKAKLHYEAVLRVDRNHGSARKALEKTLRKLGQ